jgi:large subunit ribosomal protein L2
MGKRIISQARGKGSHTYRVRRIAYRFKLAYPKQISGEGTVIKLLNSRGHTAPLAKINSKEGLFYIPAFKGMVEGQKIKLDTDEIKEGNIVKLKHVPMKTRIYNIEAKPRDGGKFIKTAGTYAEINKVVGEEVFILLPSKKERKFHPECRVTIGVIAGAGRMDKPLIKAGKKHHMAKARNKLWPRTSAVKMNVIDHPFGSGRGKNPKSKIAKRNAPPGKRVGHIRPRRTGRTK